MPKKERIRRRLRPEVCTCPDYPHPHPSGKFKCRGRAFHIREFRRKTARVIADCTWR